MQDHADIALFDRFAMALLAAACGAVTAGLVWFVVALASDDTRVHTASFVFAAGAFAIAGFITGTSFARALGVWFVSIWVALNAAALCDGGVDAKLFCPLWATVFLAGVLAITIWLALP